MTKQKRSPSPQESMPSAEEVQAELAKVQSMDDFFGKDGVFARLFATTMEQMLEGELTEHLGYEPYEATGRNSGNNRNGHYPKKVRTSTGETTVQVPRDRNGEFEPQIIARLPAHQRTGRENMDVARGVHSRHRRDVGRVVWCRHLRRDHQHHHRESLATGGGVLEPYLPHRYLMHQ